jgi:DNA-binding response OmpR family regulator
MKNVFVADDDPALLNVMKFTLAKMEGIKASFFDNGLDLYRAIQASPPDAIISDIILPKLEGLAVSRLVKFDENYRRIPLMIISSVIDPDIDEQVKKVKADDFLKKPFRPGDLRDRLQALLNREP